MTRGGDLRLEGTGKGCAIIKKGRKLGTQVRTKELGETAGFITVQGGKNVTLPENRGGGQKARRAEGSYNRGPSSLPD